MRPTSLGLPVFGFLSHLGTIAIPTALRMEETTPTAFRRRKPSRWEGPLNTAPIRLPIVARLNVRLLPPRAISRRPARAGANAESLPEVGP